MNYNSRAIEHAATELKSCRPANVGIAASDNPPIAVALIGLTQLASAIGENLAVLEKKISPVLGAVPTCPECKAETIGPSGCSSIEYSLDAIHSQLLTVNRNIDEIRERVRC